MTTVIAASGECVRRIGEEPSALPRELSSPLRGEGSGHENTGEMMDVESITLIEPAVDGLQNSHIINSINMSFPLFSKHVWCSLPLRAETAKAPSRRRIGEA
jgi:hypothetical protein